MITTGYVEEMVAYSRWQNDRVYQHCENIGPDERKRDRGMFFGSIYNTLDHICVVNQSILTFLDGFLPDHHSTECPVWPDWEDLKSVRLQQEDTLIASVGDWDDAWLSGKTGKRNSTSADLPSIPRWVMIVQLFNHQTHHRSQVTSALHFMGIDYGATDIPWRPGAGFFS